MKKEFKNLDDFKGNNPFTVPDGYFEGLQSQIMSKIPEKIIEEPKKITMMDRMRPLVYMAAVFAGLGLFFNLLVGNGNENKTGQTDSMLVQNSISSPQSIAAIETDNDEEYLEYLEEQYANYILAEEWSNYD